MLIPFRQLAQRYGMKPKGVLHVGAHFGQEAPEYAAIGCNRMIFIEAIPEVYEKLKENTRQYMDAMAINACISDVDGDTTWFNIANNEGQSSSLLELGIHKTEHPDVMYSDRIEVTTTRLDTLFNDFPLECDMLNLDLQGAELMALKSLGSMLNDFKWLYIEVNKAPMYVGCPLVEEIDEYVSKFGFHRVETKWCGRFSWGDSIYIKS
jgi:FkbM family methyltransferase